MGRGFESNECSTIGASYESKTMKVNDKEYTLSIWDTVGQEKFRSLTKIFLKDSKITIIVYSITNKRSSNKNHWTFKPPLYQLVQQQLNH